jgi:hypothetical protein
LNAGRSVNLRHANSLIDRCQGAPAGNSKLQAPNNKKIPNYDTEIRCKTDQRPIV